MNKKGFTLVELLAVIIIISLLALLTSTSITKMLKDAKGDLSNIQIASIKAAAESWGADNLDKLPESGECKYLTLKNLKDYGILDSNIIDPKNNESISNELKIKISSTTNSFGNLITDYEVNPESIEGCTRAIGPICIATNENTKTTGNIPSGEYNAGDEYICKVANELEYHFFVLEKVNNNVTLLAEKNMCNDGTAAAVGKKCLVEWDSSGYVSDGPRTINNYLDNLKLYWTYLEYEEIGIPSGEQLKNTKCEKASFAACELWADNYLNKSEYVTGGTNILDISGYWTIDVYSSATNRASAVSYKGFFPEAPYVNDKNYGLRPIITIPISSIE